MSNDTPKFQKGDAVEWNTSQGTTHGTIVGTVTASAQAGGHTAHATKDEPQYRVRSDKTGSTAIHKPGALRPYKAD
ncbi:DUF2945 domain-containing protein [Cognatilysobacter bugurensis]|uniref:Hypervirulence associated protein TUDOR domain-containing protein n=1 Tax=Cognatilysobacter bugurensis TaxID=543356 RepID=A0A918T391_9GAMM|nr:DUF2945 domain-containing protein [Lysobacter bugurensis]GHA89244.1 hypothetical protein GCM10007067_28950 [Lysobacter bugurensis]